VSKNISPPAPLPEAGVLLVGGTAGTGLASAMAFARAGVKRIALTGRNPERGEQARAKVQAVNPEAHVVFIAADVNDPQEAQRAGQSAWDQVGPIDVLVNTTHGGVIGSPLVHTEIEDIGSILTRQVIGMFHMCKVMVHLMKERKTGSIINISSDAAKVPTPGETVIGAGMAAINMFSKTLALETKRDGIRVNIVSPSLIAGTSSYDMVLSHPVASKVFSAVEKMAPLGISTPEDLAELVVFLASPQAALITGQAVSINGGLSTV